MGAKHKRNLVLLVLLSVALILLGGFYYISSVQNSLWDQAVTNILEVTAQGRHALDTYIEKDMEMLHWLATEMAALDSHRADEIQDRLTLTHGTDSSFLCVDLTAGKVYDEQTPWGSPLEQDQLEELDPLHGSGIQEPFLDRRTGVWTIGYYEHFFFANGAEGVVQKTQPLSEIAQRFSLSFYDDTGFSYVLNGQGDILIRTQHPNSNRTFQNLFDIIDLQGNNKGAIASFQGAMKEGERGVARFQYKQEDYVFCYVPLESAWGWYVISIVPDQAIMRQTQNVVQDSKMFFILILIAILVLTAFFLMYRNSTRQVLAAEEQARRAAESANRAKSRFLSNMSHDIRTPMNAIIGMTKLASDHLDEPEKVKGYLKNISLSGQLLVGLINDILDLSKIESGKMTLNNDTEELDTLMLNLVHVVQPMTAEKGQSFDIRLHDVQHETLYFDGLRLNQVMLNLLSNAVKFTPEGGAISVDVTESPAVKEGFAHFTFCVADNGIGMKPDFLEHLFDAFTREQDSRVNKINGSGLGMAITKMIVDMMEGSIQVESAPGEGTKFTVGLELQIETEPQKTEKIQLSGLRVLLADDDAETCRSAEAFLEELGVQADIAGDGYEAVEKAKAAYEQGKPYQLVLLDWKMPGCSGVEAVRAIRQSMGQEIPVLIFSAYDWASIETEAKAAGVDGFIQKPFFKSTLYHCIRQYVLHSEGVDGMQKPTVAPDLTGRRILLAEDNLLNQEIARELIEAMGAEIDVAENGQLCVQRFKQSPPGTYDLILMDVQMPVMNGYEATRAIRSMERSDAADIPILAMTADAFAEDIAEAKRAGMNSHLAKPLDIPAMWRELQRYLKQKEAK